MTILWILTIQDKTKLVSWLIFFYVSLKNEFFISLFIHIYFVFFDGKNLKEINFFQKKQNQREKKIFLLEKGRYQNLK